MDASDGDDLLERAGHGKLKWDEEVAKTVIGSMSSPKSKTRMITWQSTLEK